MDENFSFDYVTQFVDLWVHLRDTALVEGVEGGIISWKPYGQ